MLGSLLVSSVALVTLVAHVHANTFDSNGVRIHFRDRGAGQPVVLVHGGLSSGAVWEELGVTQALTEAGFRVLAIDMRGYGKSDKPHDPGKYGLEMSHDIARLLDHVNIRQAHVIGYSQGALVANRFRANHPDRVLTATLGGAGANGDRSVWVRRAEEFADAILKGDIGPIVRVLTPPNQPVPTQEQLDSMYREFSARNDMKAAAESTRAQGFPDSADELRNNRIPTLVLIGDHDPNRVDVDWTVQVMSNVTVVVIPGADHNTAVKDPLFIKGILKFLSEHEAAVRQ